MRWLPIALVIAACDRGSVAPPDILVECRDQPCPPFVDAEGGNVMFESMTFDTELQQALGVPATAARIVAYFMDAQSPDVNPLPVAGQCNNLVATKGWPWFVGSPHVDLDIGTLTFTGRNVAGATTAIDVPRLAAGTDALGRHHDIFYQQLEPDAEAFVHPDSAFTAQLGGAGRVVPTTFMDAVFVPTRFAVTDLESNGPLVAGTDFTTRWMPATSMNLPVGSEVIELVWLADLNGTPTHLCPTAHSAGQFTIPAASIAEYEQIAMTRGLPATRAILVRQAIVHQVARLPNSEPDNIRRLDMIGAFTYAQLVDVQ